MAIHSKQEQNLDQVTGSQPESDQVCHVLSSILTDGIDVHRCLAARAVGRIGAPAAVQPLIGALLDEDEDVRTDAAEALFELADPRAAQQLLENLLGDPCPEVKLAAIDTLAKLQDRRVIPWLRRIVKGRDEEINWDENLFYANGWDDWVDIQIKAVNALADLNADEAVPDIVAAMRDENAQDMTEVAFKALARIGKPGIRALACFLDDNSARVRRRAAAALAAARTTEAAEPLARAFADPSSEVRSAAMRALVAQVPDDDRLAALLGDPDAALRAEAVQLCGRQHPDRLPVLIDDASKSVQVAALTVLAVIDNFPVDDALVTTLRAKLKIGDDDVAVASALALANVAPQDVVNDLISLLDDTSRPVNVRIGALQGLAKIGSEPAVTALVGMIDDEERSIRLETMAALANLAQADALWPNAAGDALLFALRGGYEPEASNDPEDQTAVTLQALDEETGDPEPVTVDENTKDTGVFPTSTLSAILTDVPEAQEVVGLPNEGIELTPVDMERLALAKRIKGKRRVPLAPDVVVHKDIRHFAARVLGDLCHGDVATELAAAVTSSDPELCLAAADSLARIGENLCPYSPAVAQTLVAAAEEAVNRDLKLLLIRALAAAEGETVSDFLEKQIHDEDSFVRSEAVRALFKLGRVESGIEALLDDPDPSVRLSAAQAIAGAGSNDTVKQLVDFAFSFEGYHTRQAARLLRKLDAARASALFIDVLHDPERKRTWSVAIEALEELNCPQPVRTTNIPDHEQQV